MDKTTPEQKMIHEATAGRPLAIVAVILFLIVFWTLILIII